MGFTGAHMLYVLDVFIFALYLLSHGCALLKYMYKHSWTFKYYSVLNPFNYYFVFNSLEIFLCFRSTENVNQFSIYWKCYSVFNILKMLIHFWSIQNHTLFSIYRLCYSILNICWIIPCFHSIQILICLQSIQKVTSF